MANIYVLEGMSESSKFCIYLLGPALLESKTKDHGAIVCRLVDKIDAVQK
jgi:hypothetical protein